MAARLRTACWIGGMADAAGSSNTKKEMRKKSMINNENFSDMIDAMKESDTWSPTLAEQVGEIAAASFCFGSGLLFDLIKDSMRDAVV